MAALIARTKLPRSLPVLAAGTLAILLSTLPTNAIDLGGSAYVWAGPLETNVTKQFQTDQRYTLRLTQALSSWLSLEAGLRYTDFSTDLEDGPSFFRRSQEPYLALRYERPVFSARLQGLNREIRATSDSQNLDVENYLGTFEWRPSWGPIFQLRLEDNLNTVDPAVFGRETQARRGNFQILWDRSKWNLTYRHTQSSIENRVTDFQLDDRADELRLAFSDRWLQNRWFFSIDGRYAYLNQELENPSGESITQPVPITEGLFAIDTSPEIGELAPSPGLVDGDFENPVAPPIDIGGANTFRNIGADLGITRPISQLEITVDRPSLPGLLWQVYISPDNLSWFPVVGVSSSWDGGFLRYTLQFPEIETRFIKAVNVSANGLGEVLVTELRVLVDQGVLETQSASTDEYWLNLFNIIELHERVELTLISNTRRDAVLRQGGASPGRDTQDYGAQLRYRIIDDLELRLDYRLTQLQELLDDLDRDTEFAGVALEWRPLPTVDVLLAAERRDEEEAGELIQSNQSLSLRARTDLLPNLSLVTEFLRSELTDEILGFEQTTNRWTERLIASPWRTLDLIGSLSYSIFDSTGVLSITNRTIADLGATWTPTPAINLSAFWGWNRDNLFSTLTQRYLATWTPGGKLSLSVGYRDDETPGASSTNSLTGTANYRLNHWLTLWANANETTTDLDAVISSETRSARIGLRITF